MIETIATLVSAGGLMLGIATFIVNRYDKKLAAREKVLTEMNAEMKIMQQQIQSTNNKVSTIETRATVIERDAHRLEATIENQMDKLGEKLEKIYMFLLKMDKSDNS